MNGAPQKWVVFTLGEQRYALLIDSVERIVHAVEVTPLPKGPDIVLGVISLHGQIIPVINIRNRFGLPDREIELGDHFIIAQTARRKLALAVDSVNGIIECFEHEIFPAKDVLNNVEYLTGIIRLESGLILIHDLDQLLSLDEEAMLENATKESF